MSTRKARSSARSISGAGGDNASESSFGNTSGIFENSRHEEKNVLQKLNTRLAEYIERVRHLEKENDRLLVTIKDTEVVEKRERGDITARFEREIGMLRDALAKAKSDLANALLERDAAFAERDSLAQRVARLEKDWKLAADQERRLGALLEDSQSTLKKVQKDCAYYEKHNADIEKETSLLRDQINHLKKNLEEETSLSNALKAKLEQATEDYRFMESNLKHQLAEENRKRQVEMTTVSKRMESEYEEQLAQILEESRKKAASEFAHNSQVITSMYQQKLENAINDAKAAEDRAKEAIFRMREIESTTGSYEATQAALEKKIGDLEKKLEQERHLRTALMGERDRIQAEHSRRISDLNSEIARLMAELSNFTDEKVRLDNELRDYSALLDSEDKRLSLTRSPRKVTTRTTEAGSRSGVKRRRVGSNDEEDDDFTFSHFKSRRETQHIGPVKISNIDADGEYIQLENTSEEQQSLGGWTLSCRSKGKEVKYKFSTKATIPGAASIAVWSNSAKGKAEPHDFTLKSQNWQGGDEPEVALFDTHGERVAHSEFVMSNSVTDEADPNERCSIM